jgi:hypothetical protein
VRVPLGGGVGKSWSIGKQELSSLLPQMIRNGRFELWTLPTDGDHLTGKGTRMIDDDTRDRAEIHDTANR